MSLLAQFQAGGIFMYFILAFLVCTIALIIERSIALFKRVEKNPVNFRKNLLAFTSKGDFLGALGYARTSKASLAKVAEVGLEIRSNGCADEELQARMDEKLSAEIATWIKGQVFLPCSATLPLYSDFWVQ